MLWNFYFILLSECCDFVVNDEVHVRNLWIGKFCSMFDNYSILNGINKNMIFPVRSVCYLKYLVFLRIISGF